MVFKNLLIASRSRRKMVLVMLVDHLLQLGSYLSQLLKVFAIECVFDDGFRRFTYVGNEQVQVLFVDDGSGAAYQVGHGGSDKNEPGNGNRRYHHLPDAAARNVFAVAHRIKRISARVDP